MGNNNYQRNKVLVNAVADARAVKNFFANKGFKIIYAENADYNTMRAKIKEFTSSLSRKSVAVIYYSGHATQDRSKRTGEITNYLLPINDKSLEDIVDYDNDAISMNYILNKADNKNHGLNIAMLDACRTPIGRGGGSIQNISAEGIYLVYSTASGTTASDSGAFRRSFLQYANSKMKFNDIFLAVKRDLIKTGQKPIINDETNGEPFYFNKPTAIAPPKPQVVERIVYRDRPQQVKPRTIEKPPQPRITARVSQQPTSKWITPKDTVCKANGGKIDKDGDCKAEWEDAKNICRASGGNLPTKEVLGQVVTDCGGILNTDWSGDDSTKNRKNSNYKSCYKSKGFFDFNYFWSSTTTVYNTNNAWIVSFGYGTQYDSFKVYSNYVRCVRAGQ